jgi:uncharacterized membrane protein YphA (DoxX/SURF4 family)
MSLPGVILQGILARTALAVLRIYLGVVFLIVALRELSTDYTPAVTGFLERVALEKGHPFYQALVQRQILPNVSAFAALVVWGGLLVGVCLVLGLATRAASVAALIVSLNYMFARGAWFWTPSSSDAAHVAIALALIIGAAGRTLGLDAVLVRRWPRAFLW